MPPKRFDRFLSHQTVEGARHTFDASLSETRSAQEEKLLAIIDRHSQTAFGQAYDFATVRTVDQFRARVPLSTYVNYIPYVEAIKGGNTNVLTSDPVERLHLSSGTNGTAKCIPFTESLRQEFFAGIGPWMANLTERYPEAMSGASHWVVSPPCTRAISEPSAVPIGFDEDESYFPVSMRKTFADSSALPDAIRTLTSSTEFYYATALFLLQRDDLSLLSLWSPSYFTLILDTIRENREALLRDLHDGCVVPTATEILRSAANPTRAKTLEGTLTESRWHDVWPRLRLISCWKDGWSALGAEELAEKFPGTHVQGKGLLATEAFFTLPYEAHPASEEAPVLSVCSHFFEFLKRDGEDSLLAHELTVGEEYEIVVTTSGGLYRYRMGDRVRCEGWLGTAPRLRFLGRAGAVSDLCGEKLEGGHVERILKRTLTERRVSAGPIFLAPLAGSRPPRYGLYIHVESSDGVDLNGIAQEIDEGLRENFYYDQCRRAGQLGPPAARMLDAKNKNDYLARRRTLHRDGTVKWKALETTGGWEDFFS